MSFEVDSVPYLESALRAARRGGEAVMNLYDSNLSYMTKQDRSPVTHADLESNKVIRNILDETKLHILSEEDADFGMRLGVRNLWIVDPLDGTSDFLDHTGEFTIMVALVQSGLPVLGVVYWPAASTTYAAWRGGGAWRYSAGRWERVHVGASDSLRECTVVTSRHHLTGTEEGFINSLGFKNRRTVGSSLKVAQICAAQADAYITFTGSMKEWDTAASHCIIHEAGGQMTDMLGNKLEYNRLDIFHRNGILATNGLVHGQILDAYKRLQQAP